MMKLIQTKLSYYSVHRNDYDGKAHFFKNGEEVPTPSRDDSTPVRTALESYTFHNRYNNQLDSIPGSVSRGDSVPNVRE